MSQSSSIPRLWEEISSLLCSAAAQSNELSSEHAHRIELVMLSSPLSTTTDLLDVGAVKKLVQAKVPLKVWQACSKLAKAGTPHKAAIAVSAAARLFRLLVGRDQAGAALSSKAGSTLRGLQQQFQQSGLLLQLPNLLTACACKVQAATAAAAAAGVSVAADAAGTHASASSSGLGHDAPERTLAGMPYALAFGLLFMFANMCELQPNVTVNTPDGAACLLPVMHLTVTARQYLSTSEGIKQGLRAHSNAHKLLLIVCEASLYCQLSMRWVAGKALDCPKSHAAALQHLKQQLRLDVRFQEWLCMEAAVMSVSKLADDAAAEVPGQQGSAAAYAALLAKANEVPEPVCQLLQQSGISREIAVLAAAVTRRVPVGKDPDSIAVQTALTRFYPVLETYIDHLKEYVQGMGGEQERQQLPEQQQRLLQLRLSLAVTLLHEAAAAPWEDAPTGASEQQHNSRTSTAAAWICHQACTATHMACMQAMMTGLSAGVWRRRHQMDEDQFQQLCRVQAHQNLPAGVAQALQQHIALLLPRVTQAQRRQWEDGTAAAATPSSTGSSSGGSSAPSSSGGSSNASSSSGGGSAMASNGAAAEEAFRIALESAVTSVGNATAWLSWHFTPSAAAAADLGPAATTAAAAAAAAASAGEICSMLEDLVRVRIQSSRLNPSSNRGPLMVIGQSSAGPSSSSSSSSRRRELDDMLSTGIGDDQLFLGQVLTSLVTGDLTRAIVAGTELLDTPQVLHLYGLLCSLLKIFCPWAPATRGSDPALSGQGLSSLEYALAATGGMVGAVWVDYYAAKRLGPGDADGSDGSCGDSDSSCCGSNGVAAKGGMGGSDGSGSDSSRGSASTAPESTRDMVSLADLIARIRQISAGGGRSQSSAAAAAGGGSASDSSTAGSTAGNATAAAGRISVTSVLPWLVLLGRCCLHAMVHAADMSFVQRLNPIGVIGMVVSQVQMARDWLSRETVAIELLTVGYDVLAVLQSLAPVGQAVAAAGGDIKAASRASLAAAAAGQGADSLLPLLHTAGLALTGFANQYSCNNPWCSNVTGPSEAALVGGRSCLCAGCHAARYCTKACQRQHWKLHKPICKDLAAAAPATKEG